MATVKPNDKLHVIISGVNSATGKGRTTRAVDIDASLAAFLEEYGAGVPTEQAEEDWNQFKSLSPDALKAKLAEVAAKTAASGDKPLVELIVDAVCNCLEADPYRFVIADSDPGTDQFYISRSNLVPTAVEVPNDGTVWTIIAAAPFGAA